MFTANNNPEADREHIQSAMKNIAMINAKKVILISTIAVYDKTQAVNEDSEINSRLLTPYGANRYELETWLKANISDYVIIRLPALFGKNIKKNFIYDFIHEAPALLTSAKFCELVKKAPELEDYYTLQDNGFFKRIRESEALREIFRKVKFNAVDFTDSRSVYQFYPLKNLWHDIQTALKHNIRLLNLAVPPLSAGDLYKFMTGENFVNIIAERPFNYDIRTKYYSVFSFRCEGNDGYIMSLQQELENIKSFIIHEREALIN